MVYFDAIVPSDGESAYDVLASSEDARQEILAADVAAGVAMGMPGFMPVDVAEEWLRSLTPDLSVQEWIFAHFTPQPVATFAQPVQLGNPVAASLPHAFIFCTEGVDPLADPWAGTAKQVRVDPAWQYRELADTHMAPVNDPRATADVLLSLL